MHVFLPVLIFLLIPSAVKMSQETTGKFDRRFPEWVNASKVTVTCNKENDTNLTRIAQYCDSGHHSCRKMNIAGVSLEKDQNGLYLTINNDSYDSWSCEAVSYIDDIEQKENFTVDFSNQPTNTSSNQETDDNSLSQEHIAPIPGPTDTEPRSAEWSTAHVIIWIIVPIVLIGLIGLIGLCIYKKKSSRKTTNQLNRENQQDMERGETGENEPMQDRVMLENGELGENGETLALGQNGRQERRQANTEKKIAPCATSSML